MAVRDVNLLQEKKTSKWIQIMKTNKIWDDIVNYARFEINDKSQNPNKGYNIFGEYEDTYHSILFYK